MKNVLVALAITFVVVIASGLFFQRQVPGIGVVAIYLLFYCALQWRARDRSRDEDSFPGDAVPERSHWPLCGPLRRFGPAMGGGLFLCLFSITNVLSLLNPFQAMQMIRQLVGNAQLKEKEKQRGDSGINYQTRAKYRLPVHGEWLVVNGGYSPKSSHSWEILGQRFALDLVKADAGFSRHAGDGTRLEQYYCYAEEVVAAADGKVVSVENRVSDAPFVGWGFCDFTARHVAGSHVIVQHAESEFAVYAHLIKGSIPVRPGDEIRQGECIGRCGHSGHSSEPHLHFHLQDSADLFRGIGLPIRFHVIQVNDELVESGHIGAAQRVRNAPAVKVT